ncbi:helicase C-terminal domain-containing protein [Belliella pelovolcani]|uniref:helicase C-terminal domain-containing protein n=1 Tax=Belliella pelovolcani TaxID=529505 RepID=UPI00391D925F
MEKSKSSFIKSEKAAIVLANRFDGIDFAGDQSRLLFLIGIPYASNLQEKFLQARMNASIIFYDRNRTRLIQAIGRCTRSPKDFSAICVIGDKDLSEWLIIDKKNKYLHPELQGELKFGIENSKEVSVRDFYENFKEFIQQTDNWNEANNEIIEYRNEAIQAEIEGSLELERSAKHEVKFQYYLWNKQYLECFRIIDSILQSLDGGSGLKGYRAFWNYQAGAISNIMYAETNEEIYRDKANHYQ